MEQLEKIRLDTMHLTPAKRALLEMRLKGKIPSQVKDRRITAQNQSEAIPLSFSQQRLWFLQQAFPDSWAYNVPAAFRLQGELVITALETAFDQMLLRHEVLRMVFDEVDEKPVAVIKPFEELKLHITDLQLLTKGAQENHIKKLSSEEARYIFDLKQGPLLRISLLKLAENDHVLFLTMHHIICDGWSMGIFAREIVSIYDNICSNRDVLLPQLPIQYADFSYWQHQQSQNGLLDRQLEYWQEKLKDLPTLDFPVDYSRKLMPSFQGSVVKFTLLFQTTEQLKTLSINNNATLFTVLLTIFSVVLYRHTGQLDMVTGTVVANRNRAETEGLIGFFVNALPLRLNLEGNPSFLDLLARNNIVIQEAYDNQDVPFDKLVQELKLPRDTTRNPIFQVSLALDNTPSSHFSADGLTVSALDAHDDTTQFDLTIHFNTQNDCLTGELSYNIALFSEIRMQRLSMHFQNLVEEIILYPEKHLYDFEMLPTDENNLLQGIGEQRGNTSQIRPQFIHQLFEHQVKIRPDEIAVSFQEAQLSYAELNTKANQLAYFLREGGVKPGSRVAICLERSVEMIVAIFAILKAGGCYLPIDPNYPHERKQFMLNDGEPLLVLTHSLLLSTLPTYTSPYICMDGIDVQLVSYPIQDPELICNPLNLAYIIYTSGSTGKPKGVAVSHHNIVCSTLARFHQYQDQVRHFLLIPSFAFDSSVAGIFWTLSQGGCLHLTKQEALLEPRELVNSIINKGITHFLCLPSLYQVILHEINQINRTTSLRVAIVAGESCQRELVRFHDAVLPTVTLFNEYGPTEGTVWATIKQLQVKDPHDSASIGSSIVGTALYLLNSSANLVPYGALGEIYIGGEGLTRGYWNRPDQTASRFIPNPFKSDGSRLYKTGDLARFYEDGNLQFLGRVDNQIKIRGFRIELGEIEHALIQYPDIQDAVVVNHASSQSSLLVAYYVSTLKAKQSVDLTAQEDSLDQYQLKNYLQAFLPEYMVPTAFVLLEEMPLTPNGKVDRKKLATMDVARLSKSQFVIPRSSTEKALARIWSESLGVDQIGVYDDFFQLGGHSILSVQVMRQVNAHFRLNLPIAQLFQAPSIAKLARAIDDPQHTASSHQEYESIDLLSEAVLEPTIYPVNAESYVQNPKEIFLTGATGFLGAFLLHELLQKNDVKIHCLVRASSQAGGFNKLKKNFERYGIYETQLMERVIPVCGDLSQPRLGLSEIDFALLANNIDSIYHNGALVNFSQPYSALKVANVGGTHEILRLACMEKVKPVHYISTLSVLGIENSFDDKGFTEDDFPKPNFSQDDGYSQTKWVAEKLIRIAASRGLPVTIHRPSTVIGHSTSGAWNPDDFLCRLIRGCIDLGKAPKSKSYFDVVTVDYVSKAIVNLSYQSQSIGDTFHYDCEHSLASIDLIRWVNELGFIVRPVSYREWRESVVEATEELENHPLYPLLNVLPIEEPDDEGYSSAEVKKYNCSKTKAALKGSEIEHSAVSRDLWGAYLAYLQQNHLLNKQPYQNGLVSHS